MQNDFKKFVLFYANSLLHTTFKTIYSLDLIHDVSHSKSFQDAIQKPFKM